MIRIAVVEDDLQYIEQMKKYLDDYRTEYGTELDVKVYRDGDQIVSDYHGQFDIIFMDIQMRFVDGMTAAEEIRKVDSRVAILFMTSMPQYAIRGYQVDALDYVLKPVSYFEFSRKLERAISKCRTAARHYITFTVKGGMKRVDIADIYYVESQGHNLIVHTGQEAFAASGTMKAVEDALLPFHFSRANKGYLVNLAYVDGVQDKCACIKGEKLLISRPRMNEFMQDLTRYWSEVK